LTETGFHTSNQRSLLSEFDLRKRAWAGKRVKTITSGDNTKNETRVRGAVCLQGLCRVNDPLMGWNAIREHR